ncbi:TPA: hypothetical protein N0F65_011619 [Lagenidium giganteum]|uniref:PX domain-containing protein n=1 Tax=Lagenidium giganteum TaxID=4803 RepID=A0AAV2ZFP6_9STRA|nr:TPA: hypothetical protein N0F65_011619 [Lagenidium giganteum]
MTSLDRFSYSRNGAGALDENCQIRVAIASLDTINKKVQYHVRVQNVSTMQTWEVSRRYSEFLKLRNDLIESFKQAPKKCPGCKNYEKVINLFEFPKKHLFTSTTPVVLNYRKRALRAFLALLASHTFTPTPKCPTCSGFPFTAVRDFLTDGMIVDGAGDDRLSFEQIRDSIKVHDFIDYHPVSDRRTVTSDGQFRDSASKTATHQQKVEHQHTAATKPRPATKGQGRRRSSGGKPVARDSVGKPEYPTPPTSSMGSDAAPAPSALSIGSNPVSDDGEDEGVKVHNANDSFVSFSSSVAGPSALPANGSFQHSSVSKASNSSSLSKNSRGSRRSKRNSAKQASKKVVKEEEEEKKEEDEEDPYEEFGSVNLNFLKKLEVADGL